MGTPRHPSTSLTLPTRDDRPDADMVVIYDGQCGFCRSQVARLNEWDTGERIAYMSLHDPEVYRNWPQLSKDRLMESMCLVDQQGEFHWGADVFRYLSRRVPRLWWLALLMHIPLTRGLQGTIYRWIARRRYQLGGDATCNSPSCDIHR